MVNHVRINRNIHCLKEVGKTDTVNGFADAFVFKGVFCKEVNALFGKLNQCFVIFVGFELQERMDDGTHLVTNLQ